MTAPTTDATQQQQQQRTTEDEQCASCWRSRSDSGPPMWRICWKWKWRSLHHQQSSCCRHWLLVFLLVAFSLHAGWSLRCYRCALKPSGKVPNTTRSCVHFEPAWPFEVDCPLSTLCMKRTVQLDISNGNSVSVTVRDCAPQTKNYQSYQDGKWKQVKEVDDSVYDEGCMVSQVESKTSVTEFCFCKGNLCNSVPGSICQSGSWFWFLSLLPCLWRFAHLQQ